MGDPAITFRFTVPGQPPSGNHRLEAAVRWTKPKGSEKPRPYIGRRRADGVENYMLVASTLAKQARPSGWEPTEKLRVNYTLFLDRPMDADNATKVLSDAIALGLGIDDRRFLICVQDIFTGVKDFPHVLVEIGLIL